MANVCEHCKRSMSSHDNHASCPQCRMAAGECSLDSENPCTTCKVWTRRQWGKLRRSLIDARVRSCQRGRQHWSAAFPRLEAWIQSKPASTSASEISSQAGEGDFEEDTLVGTPEQQVMQVLVVQAQNGANVASGTAITAPSTSTTAPSTAPLQVAGPSTMEPIVEQLGQDTPSVIQGARPDVRMEQTAHSTQRYGTLPYMRHYKAAGFSDEVSRLAAAPRRPSTNRLYDDRWRRLTRWAAGQGVDPLDPTALR